MRWAAVAVAMSSIVVSAPAAHAGAWTPVDNGLVDTSRPAVSLRKGTTSIVWATADGELVSRTVSTKGRMGSPRVLQRGWSFLSADPVQVGSDVVAAGTRALPGSSLYWAGAAFATDGGALESLSDDYAYLSQGQDALGIGGRLLYAYTDGGSGVQVATPGRATAVIARGTALEPALAGDGRVTYLGWYSSGEGVVVSEVSVQPAAIDIAPPTVAPGSQYAVPGQRVALVVRKGRPWVAYPNDARRIRVWRPGQAVPAEVITKDPVVAVDLAVAGSRLWLAYATTKQVCVQRSAGVTFGAPSCRTAVASGVAVAAGEYADVVATVAPKVLHRRFLPAVSVTARPRTGIIVVRDAGEPVAGARVRVGTQKGRTNAAGKARLKPWPKKQSVEVRASGYESWTSR
jgi:hypothetical protein